MNDVTDTWPTGRSWSQSVTERVSVPAAGVAGLRDRVTRAALLAGLTPDDAARFTLAVNEIVINAVLHGGGTAHVTIAAVLGRVEVEVRDDGPGFTARPSQELPPADQPHGRGLWLARHLCHDLRIDDTGDGVRVRLSAPATRSPAAKG